MNFEFDGKAFTKDLLQKVDEKKDSIIEKKLKELFKGIKVKIKVENSKVYLSDFNEEDEVKIDEILKQFKK